MSNQNITSSLSQELQQRILTRLGLEPRSEANLDALCRLYRAWCDNVPFDNTRKMIALRTAPESPLPGSDARDFFEHWLADGSGGTCWAITTAFDALARSLGFSTSCIVGSMFDVDIANHASLRVRIDEDDWLVDASLLYNAPLLITQGISILNDLVFAVELEAAEDGSYVLWADLPPYASHLPCRLYRAEVDATDFTRRYEASREQSPFNQRLYARRNHPGELRLLIGNTRFVKTASGLASQELRADGLIEALHEDIGLSEGLIEQWVNAGCLDASLEPPAGPPPPLAGVAPSRRQKGEAR